MFGAIIISPKTDTAFAGSIPALYQRYLVPLIFEPYAVDLALRVLQRQPARVLEIAAGTGAVTRQLAATLSPDTQIVATDLNQPMLDHAATVKISRPVEWRQADAMQLPFQDEIFDVVVCQFGVMFFPDKTKAFSEARRVLRAGGYLLFNVWDQIKENEFADTVTRALETVFPSDPPRFMVRIPHGYHDLSTIAQDLRRGGFTTSLELTTLSARSCADSPRIPAIAYCHGTPFRSEIEARDPSRLAEATDTAEDALRKRFGPSTVDGKIQAHIIAIER